VRNRLAAMPLDKYHLNLAGEYRVAAELLKRGIFATITYGNKKGADIYAIGEDSRQAAVIEVKALELEAFRDWLLPEVPGRAGAASGLLGVIPTGKRRRGVLRSLTCRDGT
jgi:hypothetical protein